MASSPRKDPFVGVIAVGAASLLTGRPLSVMLVSVTGALASSLLIVVGFLIFVYLAVSAARAKSSS